jgi:DNA-binding beta-propeller fold protein YncE
LIEFINTSSATVVLYPNSVAPISIPPGHIFTIAGGSLDSGSIGNGNFALNARFNNPADVAVSPLNGDIYIADVGNKAVRKIDRNSGIVSSVLTGSQFTGLGFDTSGRLYVANFDTNHVLRETSPGSGQFAQMDTGSGLNKPRDVAVDAAGNAYVTNSGDHTIRKISPDGTVTLFAGISSTSGGSRGDQVLATAAELNIAPPNVVLRTTGTLISLPATVNITISPTGEILFADSNNNRIRRLR